MPELPEVETIKRGLDVVLSKKIIQVKVLEKKSFIGEIEQVLNTKITQVRRRGKALLIDLDNGWTMMIHLRMTGQVIFRLKERGVEGSFAGGHPTEDFVSKMPSRHTRVIFEFSDGAVYFNDQRKFGFVKLIPTEKVEEESFIKRLGREPWEMRGEEFYEILQRKKGSNVKSLILDQGNVAGVGNIYADEALFFAEIDPRRRAGSLSKKEAERLLEGMGKVMQVSIELGGSSMANYVKADGSRGDYLEAFAKVFNRQGRRCERCGGEVKKIKVSGRGTHYCPRCQK